jgi:hypothetical protein
MNDMETKTAHPMPEVGGDRTTTTTTFSPVSVNGTESLGVLFLGVISLILTLALLRTMALNRKLERELRAS